MTTFKFTLTGRDSLWNAVQIVINIVATHVKLNQFHVNLNQGGIMPLVCNEGHLGFLARKNSLKG
jgi:hypothetical protein